MGAASRLQSATKAGLFVLLVGLLALPQISQAAEDERGDLVLNGDAKCTRCHDEYEFYPVLSIGKTKHGTQADARTPSCTSCHGESEAHLAGSETEDTRPALDIAFGAKSITPVSDRNQSCLNCHQGGERIHCS